MYLSEKQLSLIGFRSIGVNCKISDMCRIYNPSGISIGDDVTIKDFCIISAGIGGIEIGDNVTIEPYSSVRGQELVRIYSNVIISSNVNIFSSSNDYVNDHSKIKSHHVIVFPYSIIGCGSVILPGSVIGRYSSIGALSLVKNKVPENEVWGGVPAKFIKKINSYEKII